MTLIDQEARRRALTALDENLLVEAAAGTGKTALMAGRCALLLASGIEPGAIAAITFTELSAGELSVRIGRIVEGLLRGDIPPEMRAALPPTGLSEEQREALRAAAGRLDDLTATTIHGFCQGIIRAYAVEANLDPGAAVMDGSQADAMFAAAFTRWLRARLSADAAAAGAVGVLAADDPLRVVETLWDLARLRRSRPTARAPAVDLSLRPDLDFIDAVDSFERWFAGVPGEPKTADILEGLRALAAFFTDAFATPRSFAELWTLASTPRPGFMKPKGLDWRTYAAKTAWQKVSGSDGADLFAAAAAHYEACRIAFATLMGQLAGALVEQLSGELDELLEDYAARKRAAAALDFDDLLIRARALVREHEPIRRALGARYRHIFVDEFQDTDPLQAEVIFSLASDELPERWIEARPRPGALFLVGDPKQAIYRFRGAHVAAYTAVRERFASRDPASIVQVTANFRSDPQILEHVNASFREPFAAEGQPGYVALTPTLEPHEDGLPRAARLSVDVTNLRVGQQRDAEAEAVADLCHRLIGSMAVRRADGSRTPVTPGDIALLAPRGTELWRYERALERRGLGVASQAGKALMRRQETQDVLALLRALADPFDTLAFGAFLRGPMVGLTEARLLAITAALPLGPDGVRAFTIQTDPALVADAEARIALEALQVLRRRAASATPAALLAEAIERLNLRVVLALRTGDRGGRAIANLDALVALARPYRVQGLNAFVAALSSDWASRAPVTEGRIDESEMAVSLVTIHSAKGLEWPVVIPVNTVTNLRAADQFVHRQSDDTLHWVLGGLPPPHLAAAQAEEAASEAWERERLWYVAMTRARDLLVLPEIIGASQASWARVVNLQTSRLPEIDLAALTPTPRARPAPDPNPQTAEVFAAEAAVVAAGAAPIVWRRPSDHDSDRAELGEVEAGDGTDDLLEVPRPAGAGRVRGILLHKLMEEMVTGELSTHGPAVVARAIELSAELRALEAGEEGHPDPAECAATALRARELPEMVSLWPSLQAEVPLFATDADGVLVAGRADALSLVDGRVNIVVDWKSDVDPGPHERASHIGQLAAYMRITGALRGALVYLSRDEVVWVDR